MCGPRTNPTIFREEIDDHREIIRTTLAEDQPRLKRLCPSNIWRNMAYPNYKDVPNWYRGAHNVLAPEDKNNVMGPIRDGNEREIRSGCAFRLFIFNYMETIPWTIMVSLAFFVWKYIWGLFNGMIVFCEGFYSMFVIVLLMTSSGENWNLGTIFWIVSCNIRCLKILKFIV